MIRDCYDALVNWNRPLPENGLHSNLHQLNSVVRKTWRCQYYFGGRSLASTRPGRPRDERPGRVPTLGPTVLSDGQSQVPGEGDRMSQYVTCAALRPARRPPGAP
eukprot:756856-Hanusia_phi.AAC.2